MPPAPKVRLLTGAGMVALLAAWSVLFWRTNPTNIFGEYHDDAVLMVSAKALATGQGYRLLHLPGTPVATKYPLLYPLVLSVVWRMSPNFPANLGPALAIEMMFGWLAIGACYLLARHFELGRATALLIAVYCAFHHSFLEHAVRLMTDALMMALTLLAAIFADRVLEKGGATRAMAWVGLLAAVATLTRTIGLSVVIAVVAVAVLRKRYRLAGVFVAVALPLIAAGLLWPGNNRALDAWAAQGPIGFRETGAEYTSYALLWKMTIKGWAALAAVLKLNVVVVALSPSLYFLVHPRTGVLGLVAHLALTITVVAGLIRLGRRLGWRTLHVTFAVQLAIMLVWSHSDLIQRYFLPFLPLFSIALVVEAKRLTVLVGDTLRKQGPVLEKAVAVAIGAALAAVAAMGASAYVRYTAHQVRDASPWQSAFVAEKRQVFNWIREHTNPSARFVAYYDAELYLYTGRQAMEPMAFIPQALYLYGIRSWEQDRGQILDVARYIGARYWVFTSGDYFWQAVHDGYARDVRALLDAQPLLFESSGGHVRLYDIGTVAAIR